MICFTYNDMELSAEETQGRWVIAYRNSDGKGRVVGARLFAGVPADEVEACARRLVRAIFPVESAASGPTWRIRSRSAT